MDVRAQALAQRGMEQVRGGVVGLGGVARGAVDARHDALARLQLAVDLLDDDGLVVARAHDVGHAHQAVAVLAGDDAAVGDLAAALGVEGRLGELHDRAPVLPAQAGDRRVLLEVLVAGEGRRLALDGERTGHDAAPPVWRERARCSPIRRSKSASPAKGTPRSAAISRVSSIGKP